MCSLSSGHGGSKIIDDVYAILKGCSVSVEVWWPEQTLTNR